MDGYCRNDGFRSKGVMNMQESRITGTVKAVSAQKRRVCIGEEWFDYEERVGNYLKTGEMVSAKLNSKGVITFVEKPQTDVLSPQEGSPPGRILALQNYQSPRKWNGQNSHHIRRQACLNTAVAVLKLAAEHGMSINIEAREDGKRVADDRVIAIAEKLEKWVLEAKI